MKLTTEVSEQRDAIIKNGLKNGQTYAQIREAVFLILKRKVSNRQISKFSKASQAPRNIETIVDEICKLDDFQVRDIIDELTNHLEQKTA